VPLRALVVARLPASLKDVAPQRVLLQEPRPVPDVPLRERAQVEQRARALQPALQVQQQRARLAVEWRQRTPSAPRRVEARHRNPGKTCSGPGSPCCTSDR